MAVKIASLNTILFKGFKKCKVIFHPGLNLLVGGNNSGKSSLLQAIYLAFDFLKTTEGISEVDKKKAAKEERLRGTSIKNITLPFHEESYISEGLKRRTNRETATKIEIALTDGFEFMETATFPGGNLLIISSDNRGHAGSNKYRKQIENLIKSQRRFPLFIPSFSGVASKEEIKQEVVVKYYIALGRSNEVLRNQLQSISPKKLDRLNTYLNSGFGMKLVSNSTKEIFLSALYKEGERENMDISSGGSGFQQILQILVYIVSSNADVILIDEPDAHLHYKLQHVLYDILLDLIKDGKQIIVATHSQVFIKKAIQNSNRLILVDKNIDEQKSLSEYAEGIRELYKIGLIDEYDIAHGASLKVISLEDSIGGNGFNIMQEFLKKIGIKEPKFRFISSQDSGNHTDSYIQAKSKIENVKLEVLEFRDSDSLNQEHLKTIKTKIDKNNFNICYTNAHETENYLINSKVISRVLENKNVEMNAKSVEKYFIKILEKQENRDVLIDSLRGALDGQYKRNYREIDVEYGMISVEVDKRVRDIRDNYYKYPYELLPGKEIMRIFKGKIKDDYNISISETEIAQSFKEAEIPKEIRDAINVWKESKK
ncbi:MAG: AAA family ATPase [Candidatus Paceibacterota bacterium]|jgi:predicted ATPase